MDWRNYVKDILMIAFAVSLTMLSPITSFFINGEFEKGFILFFVAGSVATGSMLVAAYWHKRDIHATLIGNIASGLVVLASPFVAYIYGFSLWPLIIIIVYLVLGIIIQSRKIKTGK